MGSVEEDTSARRRKQQQDAAIAAAQLEDANRREEGHYKYVFKALSGQSQILPVGYVLMM